MPEMRLDLYFPAQLVFNSSLLKLTFEENLIW